MKNKLTDATLSDAVIYDANLKSKVTILGLEEIKRLSPHNTYRDTETITGTSPPSTWTIMEKINEIIEKVNILIDLQTKALNR